MMENSSMVIDMEKVSGNPQIIKTHKFIKVTI